MNAKQPPLLAVVLRNGSTHRAYILAITCLGESISVGYRLACDDREFSEVDHVRPLLNQQARVGCAECRRRLAELMPDPRQLPLRFAS